MFNQSRRSLIYPTNTNARVPDTVLGGVLGTATKQARPCSCGIYILVDSISTFKGYVSLDTTLRSKLYTCYNMKQKELPQVSPRPGGEACCILLQTLTLLTMRAAWKVLPGGCSGW